MKLGSMLLAAIEGGRWKPGIGDPTAMGWITVAAYLVSAACCLRAAWREPSADGTRRDRPSLLWLVLAILLVMLGINKQLDLQSLLTEIGRDVFRSRGLYDQRHDFQVGFIVVVASVSAALLTAFLWAARRTMQARWPALVGMTLILAFVVIRAASFHHVDVFLAARLGWMKWNWILELGGIVTVGLGASRIVDGESTRPPRRGDAVFDYYRRHAKSAGIDTDRRRPR